LTDKQIPDCFGLFVCMDDCVVSCPFWEDCMFEADEEDDYFYGEDEMDV